VKSKKVITKNVKLIGGPLGGRTVAVPRTAESYAVGKFWVYTFAGKVDRQEMFAIRPKSRVTRRLLWHLIGEIGKDPRLVNATLKMEPLRNNARVAHKRGRRRRLAKRESA
jgi:hypothetical protein